MLGLESKTNPSATELMVDISEASGGVTAAVERGEASEVNIVGVEDDDVRADDADDADDDTGTKRGC